MRTHAATVPDLAAAMLPGPYRVPAYRARGHIRLTNKTPCGTYRAPGRYESTFVRERLIDAIAAKTGIDAIEIRRRNLIDQSAMPYSLGFSTLGTDIIYDSGNYAKLMDRLLTAADWQGLQHVLARRRAAGEKVGAGFACSSKKSGLGPFDKVRIEVTGRHDRTDHRRCVNRARRRDRNGADLRRGARCRYTRVNVVHGQTDRIDKGMARLRRA